MDKSLEKGGKETILSAISDFLHALLESFKQHPGNSINISIVLLNFKIVKICLKSFYVL